MARPTRNSLALLKTPNGRDMVPMSNSITSGVAGNGPWGATGSGLPRDPRIFDAGAFGPMAPTQVYPLDPTTGQYGLADPRVSEYMPGYNLPTIPGYPDKLVPFKVLRDLSKFVMPLRTALDIKKLEVGTQDWDIRLREDAKGVKATNDGQDGKGEARTAVQAEIKTFLLKPDPWNGRTFSAWIKLVVEEINVVDALSIWLRPTKGKTGGVLGTRLTSLDIIQGDLIKPLRDIRGAKPMAPAPAYQQYIYGAPRTEFTFPFVMDALEEETFQTNRLENPVVERFSTNELLYKPFNERTDSMYGFSAVEKLLPICQLWLRRQGWHLAWFDDGDVPGMIAMLPKEWTGEQIKNFQVQWNRELAGDPQWKHRVKFMPGGQTPPIMTKPPVYDMTFDEWLIRLIALGCDVAPEEMGLAPKHGGLGGGGWAEQAAERQVRLGTLPFLIFIKEILDWVISEVFGHPEFEFAWLNVFQEDKQVSAQVDGIYVDKGIKSRYQVAQEHGWPTDDEDSMKELTITTASGITRLAESLDPPEPPPGLLPPGAVPPGGPGQPPGAAQGAKPGQQPPASGNAPQRPAAKPASAETKKAALAELGEWRRWYRRRATGKRAMTEPFIPKVLDAEFAGSIQAVLDRRPELAESVFEIAREAIDTKIASEGEAQAIPFIASSGGEPSIQAAGIAVKARDTGRVLMLQRAIEPSDPASGRWEFPGGKLEDGEEPWEAAQREWTEETGVALPPGTRTGSWTSPNGVYAGFLYEIEHEDDVPNNPDAENRTVLNPDDPDGDQIEVVAWWDPAHIPTNSVVRDEVRGGTDFSLVKLLTKYSDDQPREDDGRFASAESYAGRLSDRINAAAARGDLLTVVKLMKEARDRGLDIRVGVPNDHAEMRAQAAGKTLWITEEVALLTKYSADQLRDADGKWAGGGETGPYHADALYHGTDSGKFDKFDDKKIGSATDEGELGRGFYFSTDRQIGRSNANLVTASVDLKNPLRISLTDWGGNKSEIASKAIGLEKTEKGAALRDSLVAKGHDGVVLDYSPLGYGHQEVAVFNASSIKIKSFEKFPENDRLKMAMADVAKALLETEEQRKKRILRELEAADRDAPGAPAKPSREKRDEYLTLIGAGLTAGLTSGIGYERQGRTPRAEDAAESALARVHSTAYRMGMRTMAPDHAWSQADQDMLSKIVQGQMGYFQGFLNDVRAGQLSDEQIRARTALYAETLWGSFNRGLVTGGDEVGIGGWVWNTQGDASVCGLCEPRDGEHYTSEELPGFPGEGDFGDLCEGACRCWLEPFTL